LRAQSSWLIASIGSTSLGANGRSSNERVSSDTIVIIDQALDQAAQSGKFDAWLKKLTLTSMQAV
jgi:hypothetical protein